MPYLSALVVAVVVLIILSGMDKNKSFRGWYHDLPPLVFWPFGILIMAGLVFVIAKYS